MSNQSELLQIETQEKKFNNWTLNFAILEKDSLRINMHQNNSYNIYHAFFTLSELQMFKSFTSKNSIKEIIDFISDSIEKDNIKIEEKEKKSKLIIISDNISNELVLNKKEKLSEEIIEILINQIEFLKNKNAKLEEKIKSLFERNEIIEEKISNIENEKNLKNKSIMSISINGEMVPQPNIVKLNEIENKLNKIEFLYYSNSKSTQITNCNLKQINSINPHYDSIKVLSKFPSGNLISVSNEQAIKIFDTNYNIKQTIDNAHLSYIRYINIKDENNFVTCSQDRSIKTWIKIDGIFKLNYFIIKAHKDWINKVIYHSNGNLISCSLDKTIKIWEENYNNYNLISTIIHSDDWCSVCSILLLENKNILLSSGYNGTNLWNINNLDFIYFFKGASCYLWNGICKMDEDKLIVGDRNIKIFSLSSKKIVEIKIPFRCCGIKVIEEKGLFLVVGESKNILIYRNDNYKCIKTINNAHKKDINGLIKLENDFIASFSDDGKIKIWSFKE